MFLLLLTLGIAVQPRRPAIQTRFSKKIALPKNYNNGFGCDMCTKVVQYVEQLLKDQTVESEIAVLVEQLCVTFPSPHDTLCKSVVESYLPTVLQWIESGLEALDICTKIGLCSTTKKTINIRKIVLPKKYDNGIACDMCTQVVQYIEQLLKDQTIESEIEALVDQYCAKLASPYDSLCKTAVDQSLEFIMKMLESGLEALDICTKIGLCPTTKKTINIRKIVLPKNYNNGFGCDMCTKVVQYVEQLLKDQTVESEIAVLVEQLCVTFPSPYDTLCKSVVESYLPTVLQWIESGLEALDICTKIGLCSTTTKKTINIRKIVLPKKYDNGIACDMCTQVVQYIESLLADQTVESEIEALVDQYCAKLASPYDSLCKTAVDQSLEFIMKMLESGLEALDICTKIGLCPTTKRVSNVRKIVLPKNYNNGFGCDMCTKVVQYVEQLLKDQTVESEIAVLVEQLCVTFPSPYDTLCKSVVESYLPTVLQWIESGLEALDICTKIGLCSTTKKTINIRKIVLPKKYDNGIACDMCTQVVQYIEQLLKDQTIESEIEALVDQYCAKLASPYDSLCKTAVDQSLEFIMKMLESGLEALDICTKIGLCPTTKRVSNVRKIALPKNYNNGFGCDMCTKVVQYVEQLLKDQTVESEIAVLVEQLCVTFPSPYDTLCKSVVESYLPTVLQWIESGLEALDICTKIGLCSTTTKKTINIRKIVLPKKYDNGIACDMCTQVVQYIEQLLKDQTIESEIEALVDQYCAKLASPYDSLCKTAVDQSLEFIMKMLESGLEALDICTKIGLCPTTKKTINVRKIVLPKNYNNGFGCDMCTKVVQYVEQLLKDQTVESEIAVLVEQLCVTFPSPYDTLCKSVVESYLPTVLQWIESGLEALDICTKIGLCSTTTKKTINIRKIVLPKKYDNGIACDMCTQVVQYIEQLLKDQTIESEIEALVDQYCAKLASPYDSLCKTAVDQSLEFIMKMLESGLEALDICTKIGLCPTTKKTINVRKIVLPKNYNNGFGCDMCTKVVQYVEQLLKDQTVESEIAVLVEQLCVTFPSPYDTLCKSVVESYLPTVLQWIESGLEALDICTKIGLCSTTTKKTINIRKIVLPKKYDNGIACDMCTQVVQYIEQLLKDQTIESEIEALVDQYCAKLASPYDSLCKTAVDQSLEFIMKMLESGLEALDICTKIGLCPTTKRVSNVRKIALPKNYNNGFGCDMCTKVVQYIEKLLEDQTVEEEIASLVEQLCTTFSTPYDSLCKTVIEQYLPSVLHWIEQDIEALDICTKIGLCSESKKIVVARRFSDFKSEEGCQTCKNWFKWAQDKLDEVTVEGLWKLVSEECPKVPYLKYFCQVINEQNIETLVSLISSALPPEQCCEWIKVC